MDDGTLVCYGCGLVFSDGDADWDFNEDDPSARCPDCGSSDITTMSQHMDEAG